MDARDYEALMRAFTDSVERVANGGYNSVRVQVDGSLTDDIEKLTHEAQLAYVEQRYEELIREYDEITAEMVSIATDLLDAIARHYEQREGGEQ